LTNKGLSLPAFIDRLPGEKSSFEGILIAAGSARSSRAAVHPTTVLAVHRW